MKRISAVFLSALIVSVLSACGGRASSSTPSSFSSPQAPLSPQTSYAHPVDARRGENTLESYPDAVEIELSDDRITVDGEAASADPESSVYTANDIVFYLADQGFTYGEGDENDEHEQSEADAHTVLHITEPGKYILSGTLSAGQIAVDLGEDAEEDPNAVVTLILDGIDVTCSVAPGVIFYNVYECGESDEDTATYEVDTSAAGANVIIADGSVNNVNGSYVARIYKSYTLSEDGTEVVDNKKLHKYDAAFYSRKSMNVTGGEKGDGVLNINAENEGLDSELHLTINGGGIYIKSGNDGINTNEDYVSVTTVNGGLVDITVTGETGEGDGIDSNGWLVINGGTVIAAACSTSGDAGIDSDMGIYINGGNVCATGNMLDRIAGSDEAYAVFTFSYRQKGGSTYTLKNSDSEVVGEWTPNNDFTYLIVSGYEITEGTYTLWQGDTQFAGSTGAGGFGGHFGGGMRPDGSDFIPPEGFNPENMTLPEGMARPDGGKLPEIPEGGMPAMPEGAAPPEIPEGMQKPDGVRSGRGRMGSKGGQQNFSELSSEFEIKAGGSTFMNVSPVKAVTTAA